MSKPNRNLGPLNIADPIQYAAEEYLCAQIFLDDINVPIEYDGVALSLVGRIKTKIDHIHSQNIKSGVEYGLLRDAFDDVIAERDRYKKALEFYAKSSNPSCDDGETARQALLNKTDEL